MAPPLIIAYHTNPDYKRESKKLAESLDALGLEYAIADLSHKASTWKEAVCYKPRFIGDMMATHPTRDILYTDADSVCRRMPPWEELDGADVAAVQWKRGPHHGDELLSGTMFFRNVPVAREFVSVVADRVMDSWKHLDTPEQKAMELLLFFGNKERKPWAGRLRFKRLPVEWCTIFDDTRLTHPNVRPIFEHFQFSRTFKAKER